MRLRKWRRSRGNSTANRRGTSDGRNSRLRATYTNVDGLISKILKIRDYFKVDKSRKRDVRIGREIEREKEKEEY